MATLKDEIAAAERAAGKPLIQVHEECPAAFQRMMEDATGGRTPFEVVVVSRMVHFAVQLEESVLAKNCLKANGVEVLSVRESRIPTDQH